jgi:squalene-associated FAD-dependent desaturase
VKQIAVIGSGWAGLSAALALQRSGHAIALYERSPGHQGAGGRASTAYAAGERAPFAIDNGQHVMLGAYCETLALFQSLSINSEQAFLRLPAAWFVPNHLDIAIAPWADRPAVQLLWNQGPFKQLPIAIALLKASSVKQWPALLAASLRLQFLVPQPKETVVQWLIRLKFPTLFNEQLWLPLCYATLNTPPAIASARVFKKVIQDGLLAGPQAAAMLVPRADLGSLFPKHALDALRKNGASLILGTAVKHINIHSKTISIETENDSLTYDAVVCATNAKDAARMLPADCISPALQVLAAQAPEPITTLHLNVGIVLRLPKAVCVLPEPPSDSPIQHAVVIDRSYLDASQAGWISIVLSCSTAALPHNHESLILNGLNRLKDCFPALDWPTHCTGVVIHAKQATFACTAGVERPSQKTTSPLIVLAGDYVAGDYPATLEGAIRSGLSAAARLTS